MQIDWMIISNFVIGFFAVIGFFRGWWKEAITTFLLALLVLLLQHPDWAQMMIDWINSGIAAIWPFITRLFGFIDSAEPVQIDASRASTWLVILFFVLGLSALVAWFFLPGTTSKVPSKYYTVTLIGRVLGILVGGINGFLIINLVREYLDGRNLPGNTSLQTEIIEGGSSVAPAAPTLSIQAVNLPDITILDSYIPWLIIGSGILIFGAIWFSRIKVVTKEGAGTKVEIVPPYGYKSLQIDKPKKPEPQEVKMIS